MLERRGKVISGSNWNQTATKIDLLVKASFNLVISVCWYQVAKGCKVRWGGCIIRFSGKIGFKAHNIYPPFNIIQMFKQKFVGKSILLVVKHFCSFFVSLVLGYHATHLKLLGKERIRTKLLYHLPSNDILALAPIKTILLLQTFV